MQLVIHGVIKNQPCSAKFSSNRSNTQFWLLFLQAMFFRDVIFCNDKHKHFGTGILFVEHAVPILKQDKLLQQYVQNKYIINNIICISVDFPKDRWREH